MKRAKKLRKKFFALKQSGDIVFVHIEVLSQLYQEDTAGEIERKQMQKCYLGNFELFLNKSAAN